MRGGVFVCHAAEDAGTAQRVVATLEAANVPCWIAPRDIRPGQNWPEAILDGIAAAPAMVLVFSTAANNSKHVARELGAADERGLPIVPVRLEHVEPSPKLLYFISQAQWLEAGEVGAQQWESPLVQAVRDAVQQTPPTRKIPAIGRQDLNGTGHRRRWWLWGGAAAALLLVAGLLVVLLTRQGEEAKAGPVPEGRAGMASVFPSLSDECDPVDPPGMPVKTEVYLCDYLGAKGYRVRYSRWEDGYDVVDFYNTTYPEAVSQDWVRQGKNVGERLTYEVKSDDKTPYRWSEAYKDMPFSIDVEAKSEQARGSGIGVALGQAQDDIGK
jgi:hypothetical protein